jgi:hypothetical protein
MGLRTPPGLLGFTVGALCALAPAAAWGGDSPASPAAAGTGAASVTLAARSIGSRRGDPPEKRAHAALLVRIEGVAGGFIVQGGKEAMEGWIPGRSRVVGYVIPCQDPVRDFTLATGAYWGEPEARVLPTRDLATFAEPGLTEARMRAIVDALNVEFRERPYRLEGGPSSNSFVSRFIERLGRALPSIGDEDLPGWGWKP